MKLLVVLLALFGVSGQSTDRPAYAVGQVWEYRTRPAEPQSLLKIQAIDTDEGQPVYHIGISRLSYGDRAVASIPVARSSLDASTTRLAKRSDHFLDPSASIRQWRGDPAGRFVFDEPVAQIIGMLESVDLEAAPQR